MGFLFGTFLCPERPVFAQAQAIASPVESVGPDTTQKDYEIIRLRKKLTTPRGNSIRIGILRPLDNTTENASNGVVQNIIATFSRYGTYNAELVNQKINGISLQELRRVISQAKVDLLVVTVLKPTNVDVFLYDRRTPYRIYAHSEILPDEVQYRVGKNELEEYAKIAMRRALYNYLQELGVELPRETSRPVLNADIPTWIISPRTFKLINRELSSRYYVNLGVGGSIASGKGFTSSSDMGIIQAGVRVYENFYAQLSEGFCAYNLISLSGQYMFTNKDSPFRTMVGLGVSYQTPDHSLTVEPDKTQRDYSWYVMGTAAVIFPIVEVHIKIEAQILYGFGEENGMFLNLGPSLFLMF